MKIKKSEKEWLLIKERDAYVKSPGDVFPEESVLSGLTVDEVKAGQTPVARLRSGARETGAPRARVDPQDRRAPCSPSRRTNAFTRDGLVVRAQARRLSTSSRASPAAKRCCSRATATITPTVFPEIARAVKALPVDDCIIDGEVVVLDARASRASPCCSSAAASQLAARHEARRGRAAGDVLRVRSHRVRGLRRCVRCRSRAQGTARRTSCRSSARFATLDHIEREGEAFLAQVDCARPRGNHREEGRRAVSRRAHATSGSRSRPRRPATS